MTIQEKLGQNIRGYRVKMKLSQEKFAEEIGIHRTYAGAIERGEKNITIVILDKISKALNITISELTHGL